MTVRVEKPSVNLREKLAELDKPTGIAGEAMLRAETPQEQFNLIGAGRRNLLINGDFQVSQRGDYTSAVAFNNGDYGLDRWKGARAGVTATMQQKTTDQPNGYVGKSLRVETTSSTNGYIGAIQLIEDYDRLKLREVTVSAYVRSSGVDGHVYLYDGGSYIGKGTMVTQGLGWQKVEITGVVKSTATALGIYIVTTTSTDGTQSHTSGDWIEMTQVQLELGKVATPFEHRSYGEELALCQRYFEAYSGSASSGYMPMGMAWTTNEPRFDIRYLEKRVAPTISLKSGSTLKSYNAGSGTEHTWSNFNVDDATTKTALIYGNNSMAATQGYAIQTRLIGNIFIDAEL